MPPTPWHRLFGIALTDLFIGRPWRVEHELELAIKSQRLDVLIIERLSSQGASPDPSAAPLPASTRLRPGADFRLFAVATREPRRLLRQFHPSARRPTPWPGVHDLT